jgi:hypothetical protein
MSLSATYYCCILNEVWMLYAALPFITNLSPQSVIQHLSRQITLCKPLELVSPQMQMSICGEYVIKQNKCCCFCQ